MKTLYTVNVYFGKEIIDTRTDVVDVRTTYSQITNERFTDIEIKGGRVFRYQEPEYTVEILR